MEDAELLIEVAGGVGTLTFNRPGKLNAITYGMYRELVRITGEWAQDPAVKVVVLRGAGQAFCAGGDVDGIIGDLLERDAAEHLAFAKMTCDVVRNLRTMPQPVIAQVRGVSAGAGAVIALASDLRYLGQSARFAFLFTKVGLTGADMGAAWLLPRVVGVGRASEILLLGDTVDAAESLRIGLANRVVPDDDLAALVEKTANRIASGPTLAFATTKRMIQRELDMDFSSALEAETIAQSLLLMAEDHREFHASWREKRPPVWRGK